jgi:hypothetical protein
MKPLIKEQKEDGCMLPPAAVLNFNGKRVKPAPDDTQDSHCPSPIQNAACNQYKYSCDNFRKVLPQGKANFDHSVQTCSPGKAAASASHLLECQSEPVLGQQVSVIQVYQSFDHISQWFKIAFIVFCWLG